jgi:hypothetical protein
VAGFLAAHVEPAGIIEVRAAERVRQPGIVLGDGQQVDVVAHQAIAGNPHAVLRRVAVQQAPVELAVGVVEENCLLMIPTLGDVMPAPWDHYSRDSAHSQE